MTLLRINYGSQQIEREKADWILLWLRDMEWSVAGAVVERHMKASLYVPVEADFVRLRREVENELRDQDETLADEDTIRKLVVKIREDCWLGARTRDAHNPDFSGYVRLHQQQCRQNDLDDPANVDGPWKLRIEACDRILNSNPRPTVETSV